MARQIGLVQTVRNEKPVIRRCFDAILPLIDYYFICDTISDDGTPEIIQEYMAEKNIPGEIITKEWVDYGENKTYTMAEAAKRVPTDYIMFLDPDEMFVVPNEIRGIENDDPEKRKVLDLPPRYSHLTLADREKLLEFMDARPTVGIFYMSTHTHTHYQRWQIVRNNQTYRWDYPVHECLEPTTSCGTAFIDFMVNYARQQGNSSRDPNNRKKHITYWRRWFAKDAERIKDKRAQFYFAQGFGDIGKMNNAIIWYEKRVEQITGNDQYEYISLLRLGRYYKSKNLPYKALEKWVLAIKHFPKRLEAFFELMLLYHETLSLYHEAASVGRRAPYKEAYSKFDLFVEHDTYNWHHQFRLAIAMYYTNERLEGRELILDLLNRKVVPADSLAFVQKQLTHFPPKATEGLWLGLSDYTNKRVIMVIDNFLKDPDAVREFALKQEFKVRGNYPGTRTECFGTPEHKALFERILSKEITYWPDGYNGSFQYVTKEGKTWWHRDRTDYSAMIYLSPNPAPNSGTSIWKHKSTGVTYATPETQKQLDNDSNNPDAWELVDRIGNKYNRLIIFNGLMSHRADDYFGETLEDARLFHIFFFNVKQD